MPAAGVGGSMLSIGSAAGVALMRQARGKYTFFGHLKWTPVIAAGYAASIVVHMWINADAFSLLVKTGNTENRHLCRFGNRPVLLPELAQTDFFFLVY